MYPCRQRGFGKVLWLRGRLRDSRCQYRPYLCKVPALSWCDETPHNLLHAALKVGLLALHQSNGSVLGKERPRLAAVAGLQKPTPSSTSNLTYLFRSPCYYFLQSIAERRDHTLRPNSGAQKAGGERRPSVLLQGHGLLGRNFFGYRVMDTIRHCHSDRFC